MRAGDRDGSVRSFTVVPLWQPSLVAASGAVLFFLGMCASVAWVLYRLDVNVCLILSLNVPRIVYLHVHVNYSIKNQIV